MTRFDDLKVLLVEDESTVALLLEDMLEMLGCEVAASVARLEKACTVARSAVIDFAVLDVNLDGEPVFPVARLLRERGIPFLFSTGYGPSGLAPEFSGHAVLTKPYGIDALREQIAVVTGREGG